MSQNREFDPSIPLDKNIPEERLGENEVQLKGRIRWLRSQANRNIQNVAGSVAVVAIAAGMLMNILLNPERSMFSGGVFEGILISAMGIGSYTAAKSAGSFFKAVNEASSLTAVLASRFLHQK